MEAGKPDRKIIQGREDDVADEMSVVKVACSGPILGIFFNRLKTICWQDMGYTRKREIKDDSRLWGLSNQRNSVLII